MKSSLALAFLLLVSCASAPSPVQPNVPTTAIPLAALVPDGHHAIEGPLNEDRSIEVALVNDLIVVRERSTSSRGDPLPFTLHPEKGDDPALFGHPHLHQVSNGWLVGFDQGEFGGALYWFSRDGKDRRRLMNGESVRGLADFGARVVALTGQSGQGLGGSGHLWTVSRNGDDARVLVDLYGVPRAVWAESSDSLLVFVTRSSADFSQNEALLRVRGTGRSEVIGEDDYRANVGTHSLVADSRGSIVSAGDAFVRIWHHQPDGSYRADLLMLPACSKITCSERTACRCE